VVCLAYPRIPYFTWGYGIPGSATYATRNDKAKRKALKCYRALEIYILRQIDTRNKTNFRVQAKFSSVASKLFQTLAIQFPKKYFLTSAVLHDCDIHVQTINNISTCCFIWADKEKLRAIQIHHSGNYFICVNKILVESSYLETSKANIASLSLKRTVDKPESPMFPCVSVQCVMPYLFENVSKLARIWATY